MTRVKLEYLYDTVCPWCYIGKRRLERALARRPDVRADIRWRPFLLNPDLPAEGMERRAYLERKFGGEARVLRMQRAVALAAAGEDITFTFDAISRTPNTIHSHRLVRYAARCGLGGEALEAVYHAYFHEGRDIGMLSELVALGAAIGLPARDLAHYLEGDTDVAGLRGENARAHALGVSGVPCLILDGTFAMAGAQDPDTLLRLIDLARESRDEMALSPG